MTSRELDNNDFIDNLAKAINKRGWKQEAVYVLDAGQPLALLAGQLLWVFQPFLGFFLAADDVANTARLLEEPEGIDRLINWIEWHSRYVSESP